MFFRTSIIFAAVLLGYAPVTSAQAVEASFNVGYSASEGITSNNRPLLGQQYDTIAVDSGASINFTFGFFFSEKSEVEFLWARQNSRLQADGPAGKLPMSELALYNYLLNYVYNFGTRDTRLRPYVLGGIGWTNYSFGNSLLAASTGNIEGETRFSTNWGGGVKFYFSPKVGAKVGVRWTPTYIRSDPAGIWCDPSFGCWQLVDSDSTHQFETAAGLAVRFE
jgi:opacity protein-like surface antigen